MITAIGEKFRKYEAHEFVISKLAERTKFTLKNYFPKNLNAAPQKPSNQLNFRSNFSSTCTENSNISLLMIKNLSILTIIQNSYRKPKRYKLNLC